MNHPPEVTESPIEIQLRALRTTLGDDLVRDLEDSVAPNTWRAYRSDLADFATWVAYTSAEWRAPEVVATYLRTLEDDGAYATITRLTSIHKLVAAGDYEDPTKHPRVRVTLQAIRRRLSTDQDQANPITKLRRMPTPMYPSTRPAVAIPRPTCLPCEASIWPRATWPKTTANTDPIQKSQRMPSTNDATARPLDRVLSVAAVLPSASRMVNPFSIERWTRLGTNRQTDPLPIGKDHVANRLCPVGAIRSRYMSRFPAIERATQPIWSMVSKWSAAPSSPVSDATTCHWTETASCCNSLDQKRPRTTQCGCRLPTNPTRTGTRLPASRIGSRRLDSDRRPPRRSGCT